MVHVLSSIPRTVREDSPRQKRKDAMRPDIKFASPPSEAQKQSAFLRALPSSGHPGASISSAVHISHRSVFSHPLIEKTFFQPLNPEKILNFLSDNKVMPGLKPEQTRNIPERTRNYSGTSRKKPGTTRTHLGNSDLPHQPFHRSKVTKITSFTSFTSNLRPNHIRHFFLCCQVLGSRTQRQKQFHWRPITNFVFIHLCCPSEV